MNPEILMKSEGIVVVRKGGYASLEDGSPAVASPELNAFFMKTEEMLTPKMLSKRYTLQCIRLKEDGNGCYVTALMERERGEYKEVLIQNGTEVYHIKSSLILEKLIEEGIPHEVSTLIVGGAVYMTINVNLNHIKNGEEQKLVVKKHLNGFTVRYSAPIAGVLENKGELSVAIPKDTYNMHDEGGWDVLRHRYLSLLDPLLMSYISKPHANDLGLLQDIVRMTNHPSITYFSYKPHQDGSITVKIGDDTVKVSFDVVQRQTVGGRVYDIQYDGGVQVKDVRELNATELLAQEKYADTLSLVY